MAQAVFSHEGKAFDYTPAAAVTAGDVVDLGGDLVGVSDRDIAASALGAVTVEGVYDFAKGSTAFSRGDWAYWDDANNQATPTFTGKRLGKVVAAAVSGDATVRVKLESGAFTGLIYSSVAASTAITNTTTETAFSTAVTIPANFLKAGDIIRVRAQGIATSTNSTDTLDLQLRLGTTDILATGAVDVANNDLGFIDADIVIRTIGASGTIVAAGHTALGAAGTVTAKPKLLASTTLDTTAAQSVNVSATWSVASASNSVRLDVMNVQIIRL